MPRSRGRAGIEHVFIEQKARMGLFIRTIGLARARAKIGLANLAYSLERFAFWQRNPAPAPASVLGNRGRVVRSHTGSA